MSEPESILPWADAPVVRVGDTVRRRVGPWTAAVHELLRHLERVGFGGAPRVLGIDGEGREVLSYVEGADGRRGRRFDDVTLTLEAQLLREFHDAVVSFVPSSSARWREGGWQYRPGAGDAPRLVVCHNDVAPYNVVYEGGRPSALIDWDFAGPAPVEWDIAYAAWRFVPLYPDDVCRKLGCDPNSRASRLRTFCEAYGLSERDTLLDTVRLRLLAEDSEFAQRSRELFDAHAAAWRLVVD